MDVMFTLVPDSTGTGFALVAARGRAERAGQAQRLMKSRICG